MIQRFAHKQKRDCHKFGGKTKPRSIDQGDNGDVYRAIQQKLDVLEIEPGSVYNSMRRHSQFYARPSK